MYMHMYFDRMMCKNHTESTALIKQYWTTTKVFRAKSKHTEQKHIDIILYFLTTCVSIDIILKHSISAHDVHSTCSSLCPTD